MAFCYIIIRTIGFCCPKWYEKGNVRISSLTAFKWSWRYKTHQRLLQSCWWPSMFKDICFYIDQCKICVMTKTDNRQKSNLYKRPFLTKPNEVVWIDFIVDLQKSVKGNTHILTMADNFPKFIKVYALRDCTAITASVLFTVIA